MTDQQFGAQDNEPANWLRQLPVGCGKAFQLAANSESEQVIVLTQPKRSAQLWTGISGRTKSDSD